MADANATAAAAAAAAEGFNWQIVGYIATAFAMIYRLPQIYKM
jgi:hypothetical protein